MSLLTFSLQQLTPAPVTTQGFPLPSQTLVKHYQNIAKMTNSTKCFLISFSFFFHQYSVASLNIQRRGNSSPLNWLKKIPKNNNKKNPNKNKTQNHTTKHQPPERIIIAIMIIWNLWCEHTSLSHNNKNVQTLNSQNQDLNIYRSTTLFITGHHVVDFKKHHGNKL